MTPLLRSLRATASILCFSLLVLGVCAHGAAPDDQTPVPTVPATPVPAAAPAAAATTPAPAPTTSFDAVTARLDRGGSFYLYLSAADWLSNLSDQIIQYRDLVFPAYTAQTPAEHEKIAREFNLAAALIKKSGLEQITGVGASSIALEPGVYRNTSFVHPSRRRSGDRLPRPVVRHAHRTRSPASIFCPPTPPPPTSATATSLAWSPAVRETLEQSGIPEVQKAVADGLSQFALVSGLSLDDFLQSLGGASGIILTLDPRPADRTPGARRREKTIDSVAPFGRSSSR